MNISKIILDEYNKLGRGAYGKVFEKDGFVYKITTNLKEKEYAERIKELNGKLNAFPIIYYVKQSKKIPSYTFIKRDVLDLLDPNEKILIDKYSKYIKAYVHYQYDELTDDQKKEYKIIKKKLDDNIKNIKLLKFFDDLNQDYKKIGIKKMLDIHSNNIGIDKNGNYVLFDF